MDSYGYVFFIFSSTIIPCIQIDLCTSNKQEVRLPENRRYCRSSYSLHANGVRFEGPVSSLPAKGIRIFYAPHGISTSLVKHDSHSS